jgi:hypothetical protein
MPQTKEREQRAGFRVKLLQKLTLAPEARNEPSKGAYPAGRIKKFFDTFRANYSSITMINAMSLLFLLPLMGAVGFISVYGMERFSYLLSGSGQPYLLANFGLGLSSGTPVADVKVSMLLGYRIYMLALAVTMPIYGFGAAGVMHVCTKLVWGESFICKKDKFGNDVPRMALEFFRGVKLYWKQCVLFIALFALIFAGGTNMIITFCEALYKSSAHAGHYIGLIVACIVLLFSALMLVNLLPTAVSYQTKIKDKLKNAAIFSVVFWLPTLFMLAFAAAPFLLGMINGIIMILITVVMVMMGFAFFLLMFVNYADGNSERIIVPLYKTQINPKPKNKKSKNKNKTRK